MSPAARPRSRIQQKNRELILDAALEVFSLHGFRGATLDQIAEGAGLSKPNLLYYFPSKEEAVVGLDESEQAERLAVAFLARASRGWPAVVERLVGLQRQIILSSPAALPAGNKR